MPPTKLRDMLLPKPFAGVVLWALAASAAVYWQGTRIPHDASSESLRSFDPSPDASRESTVSTTTPNPAPSPVEFVGWGDDADDYQLDWPDRTREVVVYKHEYLTGREPGALHVGEQPDPKRADIQVTVTKEVFGPDDDLRIAITKGDGYFHSAVLLQTARREQRITARVWSEDHTFPNPPPEWLDVGGHVWINTWIWPEQKPLVLDYTLYGIQGGMRHSVQDRVVIDF